MTAATHNKFEFIAAALVTLLVCVSFFASCGDSTETASSAAPSVMSEAYESFVSGDVSNGGFAESSYVSESKSSTASDAEASGVISNDGSEEDKSDVEFHNESSTPLDESSECSEEDDAFDTDIGTSKEDDNTSILNCNHFWSTGFCSTPSICYYCGTTRGTDPYKHEWNGYDPGICTLCGIERPVIYGDTPVIVDVNGVEYALTSYEEAAKLIPFKTAEKGFTIVFKANTSNAGLVLISNGDGTYDAGDGYEFSANQLSNTFHNHWCRKCGLRSGDGTHGTCQVFTCDKDCPLCGEPCEKLACHTCDEHSSDNDNSGSNKEPETVLYGDTPVIVDVNGVEYALTSYEEAAELIPFKTAEQGFTIVFKRNSNYAGLVLISNGDGTYTSGSGTTFNATRVSNVFHNHWCRKCGLRSSDGTHGTCVRYTCDTECHVCGEPCEKLACHTCDE